MGLGVREKRGRHPSIAAPPRLMTVWVVIKMKLGYWAIATMDWSIWAPVLITLELAS